MTGRRPPPLNSGRLRLSCATLVCLRAEAFGGSSSPQKRMISASIPATCALSSSANGTGLRAIDAAQPTRTTASAGLNRARNAKRHLSNLPPRKISLCLQKTTQLWGAIPGLEILKAAAQLPPRALPRKTPDTTNFRPFRPVSRPSKTTRSKWTSCDFLPWPV